jgi:anti-anti-sigma factor
MTNGGLKLAQSRSGQVCVLALTGRVDNTTASQVHTQLKALIDSGEKTILLDLAGVAYLTSAAFRVLLVAANNAERNAARLARVVYRPRLARRSRRAARHPVARVERSAMRDWRPGTTLRSIRATDVIGLSEALER